MSVNARSIGSVKTGFTWTGAWIAATLLALIFAVSLFAMNDGAQVVDRAPAGAGFTVGDQLSGGRGGTVHRGGVVGGAPQWRPIEVGGSACHQCR